MGVVYLNGEYMPIEQARIPVLDRGFLYADSVYEVIPVYARVPFRLEEHLARLEHSLAGVRIHAPHDRAGWRRLLGELVAQQPFADQAVYLQVTRGVAPRDPVFPVDAVPTVFAMSNPLRTPTREQIENGASAVSATDDRWLHCDIKSTALIANVLLRQLSAESGAIETILFRDGLLTEGSSSSVFVVREGTILAPPPSPLILPGISAGVVLELAREAGTPVVHRAITREEVAGAEEVWLSSSSKEVLAIVRLDGKPVGTGRPGPAFQRVHALFQQFKQRGVDAASRPA